MGCWSDGGGAAVQHGNRGNSTWIVEIPGGRGITESWPGRIMEGQGWPRRGNRWRAVAVMEPGVLGVLRQPQYCTAAARVSEEWGPLRRKETSFRCAAGTRGYKQSERLEEKGPRGTKAGEP